MLQQTNLPLHGAGSGLVPGPVFVCFELAGEPRGKGTHKSRIVFPKDHRRDIKDVMDHAWIHTYADPKTATFAEALAWTAKAAMRGKEPLTGPFCMLVHAFRTVPVSWPRKHQQDAIAGYLRPTSKPDDDNFLKMRDALNEIVWKDDAQSVDSRVLKYYSDRPALRVEVKRMLDPRDPEQMKLLTP